MAPAAPAYWDRVRAELRPRSFAIVAGIALVFSTQIVFHPHLLDMWDLADIALAWAEYFFEVLLIGAALLAAVVAVEQAPVRRSVRWMLLVLALVVPALWLTTMFSWHFSGAWWSVPPLATVGQAARFALLGVFVLSVRALHAHAQRADDEARRLREAQRELERQADEAQLQLLQAQIEPHFLFNTLANVRRLYRKQPQAGADAIDNLMTYLRAALPGVRRTVSTLADEFELAQAYLELFKVRMGARLRFKLDLPPELRRQPFPPMVLVTLVENAIKHGLAPADLGGTVEIVARRRGPHLEVTVSDDGIGFGPTAGGSGVGLVNIRRQLATRYGDRARLLLEQGGSGVRAQISVPWTTEDLAAPGRRVPTVAAPAANAP
jgi:sensor histidine kinase YesM